MDIVLFLSSLFVSIIISAILLYIVDINIKKFLSTKNIDVDTHQVGLLVNNEEDEKDKKDYDKFIGRIYLIFIVIFTVLAYYILPQID